MRLSDQPSLRRAASHSTSSRRVALVFTRPLTLGGAGQTKWRAQSIAPAASDVGVSSCRSPPLGDVLLLLVVIENLRSVGEGEELAVTRLDIPNLSHQLIALRSTRPRLRRPPGVVDGVAPPPWLAHRAQGWEVVTGR